MKKHTVALPAAGNVTPKRAKPKKKDRALSVYCAPSDNMSKGALVAGLVLRTLIVYIGIVGLACFICGAAGLTEAGYWQAVRVTPWHIALLSLPAAAACGVASISKRFAVGSAAVYVGGYMAICAAVFGNPIRATVAGALRVYNYALYTVSGYGYYSLGNYMVNDGYDYSAAPYALSDPERFLGVFLLCTVLALVLYFTVQRKVRFIPLALLITAVMAPILTYNIAVGTSGISLSTVFICAAVALKIYDRRYSGKIEKKRLRRDRWKALWQAKREARADRRAKRLELHTNADRVFDAALEAGTGWRRAKSARKAFLKSDRQKRINEKKQKKASDKLLARQRSAALKAEKSKKRRVAELKKTNRAEAAKEKERLSEEIKAARLAAKGEAAKKKYLLRIQRREADRQRRRKSWAGGFAGAGVALAAFLAVLIPMSTVHSSFKIIDPIYNKTQIASAYVTAYLKGNDIDLNELYAYGIDDLAPRSLTFDPLKYKEKKIFRVETEGVHNVYLRSWIGTDFIWDEGKWVSADYDTVLAYRDRFGKDFTPDEITDGFYKYVYPSSADITDANVYKNFSKYGFFVKEVNVWRVSGSSLLLFVPSHMNTDRGLLEYGTLDPAPYKYSRYFDGVYSSRFYKYGRGYSTVSYISSYSRDGVGDSIENSLEYYSRCRRFILDNLDTEPGVLGDLLYEFDMSLSDDGIEYLGTNLCDRYFNGMTPDEQANLLNHFEVEDEYSKYAAEKYTQKTGSAVIEKIAADIGAGLDGDAGVYDTVMAAVNYLDENYTYSKEPDASLYDGESPVLEAFLTDVKEGYCSHFATAACAILRELGLPVRYAEGYVASGFEPATGGRSASMRTYVTDDCAHAWIEVYIDGMGWTQFEVTPGDYSDAMYRFTDATMEIDPDTGKPYDKSEDDEKPKFDPADEPDITHSDEIPEDGEENDFVWFAKRVAIGAAAVLFCVAVYFVIKLIRKKAQEAVSERYRIIDLARSEERYNDERIDNHSTARKINDAIFEVFDIIGCGPTTGELSGDYAERMRREGGGLSLIDVGDVISAIQKEEFGHGLSFDEMSMCAEYLSDIISSVYNDLPLWRKIVLRYIKHKI